MVAPDLKYLSRWLTKPVLLHYLLPYLMLIVVVGTVQQKTIGLFESQRLFFSSVVIWLGPLPLPGGRAVVALMLMSLLAKLFLASPWHKATVGIFISHLGVLLLLLGGLITAAFSIEGFVVIGKGEQAGGFYDYHKRELTISKNDTPIARIALSDLAQGQTVDLSSLPFAFRVDKLCQNCTMAPRSGEGALHGIAQKVTLQDIPKYLEDERDLAGLELAISGAGKAADGTYITFEPMEHHPEFQVDGNRYRIALARKYYPLPFTLELLKAEKTVHPGTDLPRSYSSTVMLADGKIRQRAVLTMNHPLRYKGYTVYQSSFNGEGDETKNVSFAIVQNSGRVFPYAASVTLCLGLLVHLSLRLPVLMRRRKDEV